jgi:hypothetical protein
MVAVDRLKYALRSPQPAQALRALVLKLSEEGHSKTEISDGLEQLLMQVRAQEDQLPEAEDAILDVLDALAGWCHPAAELLPPKKPL